MPKRYNRRRNPETNKHQVLDRTLKMPICDCQYKEQAELIEIALNALEEHKAMKDAQFPIPSQRA